MTCFYDFLNDQFRCIDKYSDENYDVNRDLFISEVSFKNSLEIEVYYTCMYLL